MARRRRIARRLLLPGEPGSTTTDGARTPPETAAGRPGRVRLALRTAFPEAATDRAGPQASAARANPRRHVRGL